MLYKCVNMKGYLLNALFLRVASGPVMPALTQTMQETFQAAPQQFRSDIPSGSNSMIPLVQQNTTGNVPEAPGQAVPLAVPVFPQYTPQSEALTRNAGDSLVASE